MYEESCDRNLLIEKPARELETFGSEELCGKVLERTDYIVDGLLSEGLAVLAGSPKVGKSWLVLQLCMSIAMGEPFWGLAVKRSEVLYIALEDSEQRMQRRLLTVSEDHTDRLHICLECSPLGDELEREIGSFVIKRPELRLIVIDTFQMIRPKVSQMSYANDYADTARLKRMADDMGVCILLVHHTRKLGDSDSFNEISGTNGIAGSADTLMVLKKEKRSSRKATLTCTGRDIVDKELTLEMDKDTCLWRCSAGADEMAQKPLDKSLTELIEFARFKGLFSDANSVLAEELEAFTGHSVDIRKLKCKMQIERYRLEDRGVFFDNIRVGVARGVQMIYRDPSTIPSLQ